MDATFTIKIMKKNYLKNNYRKLRRPSKSKMTIFWLLQCLVLSFFPSWYLALWQKTITVLFQQHINQYFYFLERSSLNGFSILLLLKTFSVKHSIQSKQTLKKATIGTLVISNGTNVWTLLYDSFPTLRLKHQDGNFSEILVFGNYCHFWYDFRSILNQH